MTTPGFRPPLNTLIKFMCVGTGKVMDFNLVADQSFWEWEPVANNPNQEFKIVEVPGLGYHIVHAQTGRFVLVNSESIDHDSGSTLLVVREYYGSLFIFDSQSDSSVVIRLADRPNCVCQPQGGSSVDRTKFVLFPLAASQTVDNNSKWYIEKV